MDISSAVEAGFVGGFKGLIGSGTIVLLANHFHKGFRTNLGVSGKVALVTSAACFLACLDSEHEIHRQQRVRWIETVEEGNRQREDLDNAMKKLQREKVVKVG
jgi:hypothetical protein